MSKRTRHSTSATPQWQPITQLPLIAKRIDDQLESMTDVYHTLQELQAQAGALDDATVNRVARAYTEHAETMWKDDEQLQRWAAQMLTDGQRREVERLAGQVKAWRETLKAAVALANALKAGAEERPREMDGEALEREVDDGELGAPAPVGAAAGQTGDDPWPEKIGLDIAHEIEQHMATYPVPPLFEQLLKGIPPAEREYARWLARFAPCSVEVAVGRQLGRGFVLADRRGPLQAWFVRARDLEKVITRATPECLAAIRKLLDDYRPRREGAMVILTLNTLRLVHLTERGEIRPLGEFPRIPLKRQEPVNWPGVVTHKETTAPGVTYVFTHETWGDLGSIDVKSHGAQTLLQVNVARGEADDPLYAQRLELFKRIATEVETKFHATQGLPVPDQSALNQMTETMPLFSAFLATRHSLELEAFVRELTPAQIQTLTQQAKTSLRFASPHDAEAIQQRLAELDQLLTDPQKFAQRDEAGKPYLRFSVN
jgi:hypothetical protein